MGMGGVTWTPFVLMRALKHVLGIASVATLLAPSLAHAVSAVDNFKEGLNTANSVAGLGKTDSPAVLVGNLINVVLGLSGMAFVILLVYAGILYMQGGTDEQKIKKAKGMVLNAVIGIIVIVTAFAITQFIFGQLATTLQ